METAIAKHDAMTKKALRVIAVSYRFLTKEEFAQQNSTISSKISGIGVNIVNNAGKIKIISIDSIIQR